MTAQSSCAALESPRAALAHHGDLRRRYAVHGGVGRMFEFHGQGVATRAVPNRATICEMVVRRDDRRVRAR